MATDPTGRVSHVQDMHRGLTWKPACRAATTAPITISTALNNGDTLDGVTLATGDRVLVKDQSSAAQNGIYIVGATPTRAADMDQDTTTTTIPAEEIAGAVVFVISGTVNTKTIWYTTNAVGGTVGSTSIVWAQFTGGTSPSGSITVSGYTMSTARLLGRTTAATGAVEEISVGTGLSLSGGSLTATGGSGGSGTSTNTRVPIQSFASGNGTNTNAFAKTLTSAPTNGNLLIACIDRDATGAINNITQTNVTWTQLASSGNGSTPVVEIWKGVVAASASASLTINCATSTFMGAVISEWSGITGTLDTSVTTSHVATSARTPTTTGTITPGTADALVIGAWSTDNNANRYFAAAGAPTFAASFGEQIFLGCVCGAGYAFPGTHPMMMTADNNGGGGLFMSSVIVSIT